MQIVSRRDGEASAPMGTSPGSIAKASAEMADASDPETFARLRGSRRDFANPHPRHEVLKHARAAEFRKCGPPCEAKPKSQRDDMMVAQGQRSAALGLADKNHSLFFPFGLARRRAPNPKKGGGGWRVNPGLQSLRSLARGYPHAAPPGLRNPNSGLTRWKE